MTIKEMHEYFRTLCQKNAMQLVNVVLPEEIDIFINLSIVEKVREILITNSSVKNDISVVNSLRNLFVKKEISCVDNICELGNLKAMHYVSFIIKYENNKEYKCRIIEADKLEDTLNDYCNGASFDYPICSIFVNEDEEVCKIYNGNKAISKTFVNYIKYPNKVSYFDNIDCDVLEYLHGEIVQNAVNKYFTSNGLSNQQN